MTLTNGAPCFACKAGQLIDVSATQEQRFVCTNCNGRARGMPSGGLMMVGHVVYFDLPVDPRLRAPDEPIDLEIAFAELDDSELIEFLKTGRRR